ncbi:MAG: restriction endonuclease subunit S [Clostridia bacterium]
MTEWREEKLENIFCIVKEVFKPSNEQQFKYIGLEHIEQGSLRLNGWGYSNSVQSNKYFYKKDDVLFGKLRPYFRKIIKAPFDGVCSTDIWVCRAKNNFDQNFLFYFLANQEFVDTANSTDEGTRMPRADWNFLKKTIWNIPPLPEQKAIAEVLSSLDDKIDLLTRQNKTLEDLAQAYFRKWFIEDASDEWEVGKLGDEFNITMGQSPKGETYNDLKIGLPFFQGEGRIWLQISIRKTVLQ